MTPSRWLPAVLVLLALCLPFGRAQMLLENSTETRFQIDLKVPAAALQAYFPVGFSSSVATDGPAKDCNLRVVFIDRLTITGPEGRSVARSANRLVILVAPVKDPDGNNVQLVLSGLTADPQGAPGFLGNYLAATTHVMHRTTTAAGVTPALETQDWVFAAKSGEHLEMHIKFEPGPGQQFPMSDVRYYSAINPTNYQISHQEQVLDILRNTTTNPPDRVKEFSLKTYGGSYDKLFDKTVKVLSWDNIVSLQRAVYNP